jgi:hypothetical protein
MNNVVYRKRSMRRKALLRQLIIKYEECCSVKNMYEAEGSLKRARMCFDKDGRKQWGWQQRESYVIFDISPQRLLYTNSI